METKDLTNGKDRLQRHEYETEAARFGEVTNSRPAVSEDLDTVRVGIAADAERHTIWIEDQIDRYIAAKGLVRSPAPRGEIIARVVAGWRHQNSTLRILVKTTERRYHVLVVRASEPPTVDEIRRFGSGTHIGREMLPEDETTDFGRALGITLRIVAATQDLITLARSRGKKDKNSP